MKATKTEVKIEAFEYFMYKLEQWRLTVKDIGRYEAPNKTKNLALLFILCVAAKDEDRTTIFSLFDAFVTCLHEGIIEKDIWDHYDEIVVSKTLPDRYEGVPYEIIDDCIAHLMWFSRNMVYHSERRLVDITKRHLSWMVFMSYGEGTQIPVDKLIKESSHYARGKETFIFA